MKVPTSWGVSEQEFDLDSVSDEEEDEINRDEGSVDDSPSGDTSLGLAFHQYSAVLQEFLALHLKGYCIAFQKYMGCQTKYLPLSLKIKRLARGLIFTYKAVKTVKG